LGVWGLYGQPPIAVGCSYILWQQGKPNTLLLSCLSSPCPPTPHPHLCALPAVTTHPWPLPLLQIINRVQAAPSGCASLALMSCPPGPWGSTTSMWR
jgi:hypothetical protein